MTGSITDRSHFESLPSHEITELTDYPSQSVPYHVSTNQYTYSLSYATTESPEAFDELETRRNEDTDGAIVSFEHLSNPFYGVYTTTTNVNYGSTNLSHVNNENTRTLVDAFTTVFKGVMDNSDSSWHKPINIARAGQTIDDVQWKEPASVVAGDLLSSLILAHTLPNTNHRSSLAFTGLYLSSIDSNFSLPVVLSETPKVKDWLNTFIADSKRIITTRRNTGLFRWLHNHNIDTVIRKNEVVISLDDYDFNNTNLHNKLTEQHRDLCAGVVGDILLTTDTHDILEEDDRGKQVFSDRVAATSQDTPYRLGGLVSNFRD